MSAKKLCNIAGCDKPSRKRNMCAMHYTRWRLHGDPHFVKISVSSKGEPLAWLIDHLGYDGDDCLRWPYASRGKGYGGVTTPDGQTMGAHRYMCILAHGEPPDQGSEARHLCGNGHLRCVNPRHLAWGSRQQNVDDRRVHDTNPSGERSGKTDFTQEEVEFVRSLKGQMMYKDIASLLGVDPSWVSRIMNRKRWKDW